jgi:type II secretion system protein H
MQNVPNSRQFGLTLVELVVVIGIIALIAAVAYPSLSTGSSKKLDLAAAEIAAAMRFARSESIRTGEPHGFRYIGTETRIRIYRVDTSGSPWTRVYDVYHPLTKQLHDYTISAQLLGPTGAVNRDSVYRSTCDQPRSVYFDANGTPWCLVPETALLDHFTLAIELAAQTATVRVDGISGRVTVQ